MIKTKNNLEQIKEKIRTINPEITDELLDLLYEYFKMRQSQSYNEYLQALKQDKEFANFIQNVTIKSILTK